MSSYPDSDSVPPEEALEDRQSTLFALDTPSTGDEFGFPFPPYDIQLQLMRHLYETYEKKKIAIVESPTGTGKSLSIICSALTWLNQHAKRASMAQLDAIKTELRAQKKDEPDWVIDHEIKRRINELEQAERDIEERLQEIRKRSELTTATRPNKRAKVDKKVDIDDDEEFAPENDDDIDKDGFSSRVKELTKKLYETDRTNFHKAEDEPDLDKIIFVSRTHSQLSQFVTELRKTKYGTGTRLIPVGSRANLCINEKAKKASRGHIDVLNEKCLEMQRETNRCEFLPKADDPERLDSFRDHALATVHDIEDIEDLGRRRKVCPYYGARRAVRQAQVVTMPYNLVLQKSAREALGLKLGGNVVIFDEAHNLIDTILSAHSASITIKGLGQGLEAIKTYIGRFKSRLKGQNLSMLKQLYGAIRALELFCRRWAAGERKKRNGNNKNDKYTKKKNEGDRNDNNGDEAGDDENNSDSNGSSWSQVFTTAEVLKSLQGGFDQVNFLELNALFQQSKLLHKISGYGEKQKEDQQQKQGDFTSTKSALHVIQTFLCALTNPDSDGRILLRGGDDDKDDEMVMMKYMLLNPAEHFRDIVEQSRAVVLAGGTMAPMDEFVEQLFARWKSTRVSMLTCGHVVDKSRVVARIVAQGTQGMKLELTHARRKDEKMIIDVGRMIVNVLGVLSGGTVCFAPSYGWLGRLFAVWERCGLMDRMKGKKKVFVEAKARDGALTMLDDYAAACRTKEGAVLFAVVGGRLSEGINFSDDLARCVIMLGIPYANRGDAELQARVAWAGRALYTRLAVRAVNQAVGRAIRHRNDWAAILLCDARYEGLEAHLPRWMAGGVGTVGGVGSLVRELAELRRKMT